MADAVRRTAIDGFHALWESRTPSLEDLVGSGPVIDEAVAHLRSRGRIELSPDGRLLAVHGLSHRPTRHRIDHDGGSVHTWCAFDAVGIPAGLAIDARAVTRCPTCDAELRVALVGGRPEPFPDAVLWYPATEDGWDHLVDEFCSRANLFCGLAHLHEWVDSSPGAVLTIEEAADRGRGGWADVARPG